MHVRPEVTLPDPRYVSKLVHSSDFSIRIELVSCDLPKETVLFKLVFLRLVPSRYRQRHKWPRDEIIGQKGVGPSSVNR